MDTSVDLYISYYRNQKQGSELINSQNILVPESEPVGIISDEETRACRLAPGQEVINQSQLRSPQHAADMEVVLAGRGE